MDEKNKISALADLHQYLLYKNIQNMNELWKIITSDDRNYKNLIITSHQHLRKYAKTMSETSDLLSIIMNTNNSFEDILNKKNLTNDVVPPTEWFFYFARIISPENSKDISVQTDDIKNNTSEISTQTSSIATVELNESQSQCQTNKNNSLQSSKKNENKIKSQLPCTDASKSKPHKNNSNAKNVDKTIKFNKTEKIEICNVSNQPRRLRGMALLAETIHNKKRTHSVKIVRHQRTKNINKVKLMPTLIYVNRNSTLKSTAHRFNGINGRKNQLISRKFQLIILTLILKNKIIMMRTNHANSTQIITKIPIFTKKIITNLDKILIIETNMKI